MGVMIRYSIRRFRAALSALALAAGVVQASEDWQYWNSWSARYAWSEISTVSIWSDALFRGDMSDDYAHSQFLTYMREVRQDGFLMVQMQALAFEPENEDWNHAVNAIVGGAYDVDVSRMGTLRIQQRFFHRVHPESQWDQHRVRVNLCREFGRTRMALYDELRFDLTGDRSRVFFRNRLSASFHVAMTDHIELGVGYVRQANRSDDGAVWINALQSFVSARF